MPRGFTLLELLISVSVMSILLMSAAPSFSSVTQTVKMQRLASELNGFMLQAKSEAVMRNKDLWAHFIMSGTTNSTGDWKIKLSENVAPNVGPAILMLSGEAYRNVVFSVSYGSKQVKFSGIHGKAKNGNVTLSIGTKTLKLTTYQVSGRMRICGVGGEYYGYQACS
ncbi:prepilin-type N-terminal cleavage/methylation domain-containing protein [Vibrio sp. 03-59-1]|uniref:GspH/FimT family pseudopilin n=1 Tax=Vibrio sp. 03-59-1 TaxID=2607607 RepID=UPI001493C53F|nr:GspH/FimT family pseudopilin [Vibrio sp. 03-59-1]NOH83017.1 prepilin-type N-terminal cleavage/methylation domain-containing protein [Vibrio sp. 03-59-1]